MCRSMQATHPRFAPASAWERKMTAYPADSWKLSRSGRAQCFNADLWVHSLPEPRDTTVCRSSIMNAPQSAAKKSPLKDVAAEPAYREELKIALEELGRARATLRWMEQRHFVLVEAMEEGVVMLDNKGQISTTNAAALGLVGDREAIGRWLWGDDPDRPMAGRHPATETLLDGRPRTGIEMQLTGPDGVTRWLNVNARAVFDMDAHAVAAVLCSFSDITAHKNLELELERQATRDPLTGVYNRRYIERRLKEEFDRARRSGEPLSLVVFDLDHFKEINDRNGHVTGDRVLKRFADMLTLCLRAHDLVARLGGDEFCAILPGAT